jgi:hypothetical protein
LHWRNVLDSEISAKDKENTEAEEKFFSGNSHDIIQRTREEYGRYFGICCSYHNLKACLCKYCPSYPGGSGMFCVRRDTARGEGKKEECLCETCELFKKFRLEGDYFCRLREEKETPERSQVPPDICTDFKTTAGTIRICVLGEQNMHSDK